MSTQSLSPTELAALRAAVRALPPDKVALLHEALAMRLVLLLQRKPGLLVLRLGAGDSGLVWSVEWPVH